MKKIIFLAASVGLLTNAKAQETSRKNLEDFNAIEVNSVARVNIVQSDSNYVILVSRDATLKSPKIDVRDGVLRITGSPFRGTMELHVKYLTSIKGTDAVRITCKDTLKSDKLTVHASDASRIDILTHAKYIRVKANDAGNVTLAGSTDSLDVKVTDASRVNGIALKAGKVRVISSDGSTANIWAVYSIDANASDGSRIEVKGTPADKNTSASDGGSITMNDTGDEITPQYGSHKINMVNMEMRTDSDKKEKALVVSGDAFVGGGFVTGGSSSVAIKYGSSREFMVGFGGTYTLCKHDLIGLDVYYKSTDFFLAQNSGKVFPDSINHQAQKVSLQNFGGLIFNRFCFGRVGNRLFLDAGFYGDWTFHNKLVTWDNIPDAGSKKTIDRNLNFVNSGNYGLTFRFGSMTGVSLYFNYRLSAVFQNSTTPAVEYPQLPAYVFGVNIGVF